MFPSTSSSTSSSWVERVSRSTGKTYWFNTSTGESSWKRPAEIDHGHGHGPKSSSATSILDVIDHYDRKDPVDESRRSYSPTIAFRDAQNLFKRALIEEVGFKNCSVLDLGCGQGGDLVKWSQVGCQNYIGVDISPRSIDTAKKRYESALEKHTRFGDPPCMKTATFYAIDMREFRFDASKHGPVDIVSSMFSLHYIIKSPSFATMVQSLVRDKAFHNNTLWIMYVPDVGSKPSVRCLRGHVVFEHEPRDEYTKVTITDCIDQCKEPRLDFERQVIPIMEGLGFICRRHGGPDSFKYAASVGALEMEACRLFSWGIFQSKWAEPLKGTHFDPVAWLSPSDTGSTDDRVLVTSKWSIDE